MALAKSAASLGSGESHKTSTIRVVPLALMVSDPAAAATLAAALRRGPGLLAEIRGPDYVAADPHAAVEARDHGPLGGRRDAQAVEPRPFDPLRRRERRHDPAVDDRPDGRSDEAADGSPGKAEDRASKGPADGGTDSAEDKGGHGKISACGKQEGEGDAPPPGLRERFLDHAEPLPHDDLEPQLLEDAADASDLFGR